VLSHRIEDRGGYTVRNRSNKTLLVWRRRKEEVLKVRINFGTFHTAFQSSSFSLARALRNQNTCVPGDWYESRNMASISMLNPHAENRNIGSTCFNVVMIMSMCNCWRSVFGDNSVALQKMDTETGHVLTSMEHRS
jgi:hypothetical protein